MHFHLYFILPLVCQCPLPTSKPYTNIRNKEKKKENSKEKEKSFPWNQRSMTTHGASNGLRFTFGNRFGAPQKKGITWPHTKYNRSYIVRLSKLNK